MPPTPAQNSRSARFRWEDAIWAEGVHLPADVWHLFGAMLRYTDNDTLEFYVAQETLATRCGVSPTATASRIDKAREFGWLTVVRQGRNGRATTYRLTEGRPFPLPPAEAKRRAKAANVETRVSVERVEGDEDDGLDPRQSQVERAASPKLNRAQPQVNLVATTERTTQHITTNSLETPSREREDGGDTTDSPLDVENADGGSLINSGWHVQSEHVSPAKSYGFHAVALGEVFKTWAHVSGRRSTDWNATFGELLRRLGNETDPNLDVFGFTSNSLSISQFAVCDCEEPCQFGEEWWNHRRYRAAGVPVAHLLPDGWAAKDSHRSKADRLGLDVDEVVGEMRRWAIAMDAKRADWDLVMNQFLGRPCPGGTKRRPSATDVDWASV